MILYRFSPITTKAQLLEAVEYVATQTSLLCQMTISETLPITSLTIFSHYIDEYEQLLKLLPKLGKPFNQNNGPRITLEAPVKVGEHSITQLRIRQPDPYRMQVGCNDFEVADYAGFKAKHLANNPRLRLIERPEYEMIEFFDPDFDVLGYVAS